MGFIPVCLNPKKIVKCQGWGRRVDPSPAAKKELEQKSIREKKAFEAECKAEGNSVARVMRASSSQAHVVLFSIVESGKSYLWKWKKGSQPAESHHSSARRGPTAEGGSCRSPPPRARHFCKRSEQGGGKNHAPQKAPCSPKATCQHTLNQSSRLPRPPWALAFPMQQGL